MIVKELLTKLSYIVDDTGLKKYKANENQIKKAKTNNLNQTEKAEINSNEKVKKKRVKTEEELLKIRERNLQYEHKIRYALEQKLENKKRNALQKELKDSESRIKHERNLLNIQEAQQRQRERALKYEQVTRRKIEQQQQASINREQKQREQALRYEQSLRRRMDRENQIAIQNRAREEQRQQTILFNNQKKQAQQTQEANKSFIDTAGTTGGRTAVVTAGGLIGMAVQAMRIDKVLKELMGQGKLTKKQANELRNVSIKESDRTGVSQLGIISGQAELVRAGLSMKDIKNFTGMILDFQVASKSRSFEEASKFTTDMYFTFNKITKDPAKNAKAFQDTLDKLTQSLLTSKLDIDDYRYSLQYSAATAKSAGMDLKDLGKILAILSQMGLRGSISGTGVRRMLSELPQLFGDVSEYSRDTKKRQYQRSLLQKVLGKEGLKNSGVYDKEGNFNLVNAITALRPKVEKMKPKDKLSLAEGLVGMTGKTSFGLLLGVSEEELKRINSEMENYKGSTKETANVIRQDFATSVNKASVALSNFTTSLGDQLLPMLKPLVEGFTETLTFFNQMPNSMKRAIVILGMVVGGVGSLLAMIKLGSIAWASWELFSKTTVGILATKYIINLTTALKEMLPVVWSIGAGFATWGIVTSLAVGIGLLIGELANFILYGETYFKGFWKSINNYIKKMFNVDIAQAMTNFRNNTIQTFKDLGESIYNWFANTKNYLLDLFGMGGNMSVNGTMNTTTSQIVSTPRASHSTSNKTFIFNNKSNVGVNLTNQNIKARDVAGQVSQNITGSNRQFWSEVARGHY